MILLLTLISSCQALKDGTVFLDVMAPVNPDLNNTIFLSFIFILFGLVVSYSFFSGRVYLLSFWLIAQS